MPKDKIGYPSPFVQLSNEIQKVSTFDSSLEGRILTIVDAMFSDREQREALKSVVRKEIREHYRDVCQQVALRVHLFTDTFDGEEIEYTKVNEYMSPGAFDVRSPNTGYVYPQEVFHKTK